MAGVNFSGFNGFDFGKMIDLTIESESRPLTTLQQQQRSSQDRDSAFVSLAAMISRIQTQVNTLNSETVFTNTAASSSNTDIVTTSQGTGAIVGKYDLSVTNLAKGQTTSSTNGYTNTTDVAADGGTISFTINGTTTTALTISASTTLAGLRDAINAQGTGVVASVVNDGTNNKLVISSRTTGLTSGFVINNSLTNGAGTVAAFANGQNTTTGNTQNSQNATFTVNGLTISSASNTVSEAVPGVSLTLVDTGTASVNVTADYATLKETVRTLVSEYNKLKDFSDKSKTGALANDSVLRQSLSDIRTTLLASNSNGGRYSYLAEIGVELTQTGQLKFDETKFNTAVNSYSTDLQKLFQGTTGVSGVFDTLKTKVDNLDGTTGLIRTTRNSLDTTIKSYRDRITTQELRLEMRRQSLQKMYAAADQAMSRLNSFSGQLQALSR